jgi:GR25 family glycosyltransferase involved in LPS biosynthesis
MDWKDLLKSKCFILNLDNETERLEICGKRIAKAGFSNIERYRAIDGKHDDIQKEWEKFGNPKFHEWDKEFHKNKCKQACALGHYGIWKKIIDEKMEYAVVFEDDVQFHKYWDILAPEYWNITNKDFDVVFMGNQIIDQQNRQHVISLPVLCLHAYIVTLKGAEKLYEYCINNQSGTYTVDCMLLTFMKNRPNNFIWYAWNGMMFPDPNGHKDDNKYSKNTGLVFQDDYFISYINTT